MKHSSLLGGLIFALFFAACTEKSNPNYRDAFQSPDMLYQSMTQLTDVIIHDIFSPPVASRIYAYPSIAAYEAMASGNENYTSLAGQLNA
ncbi:MAG: phosphatidic acid phosphatase, partial [Bacteroidota bacterium]